MSFVVQRWAKLCSARSRQISSPYPCRARGDTRLVCSNLNHWPWHSSLCFARFQRRLFGGDAGISQHSWRAFLSCWITPSTERRTGRRLFCTFKKNALGLISYYYRYRMQRKFKNRKQMMTYSTAALTLLFSLPSYESQQCLTPAITIWNNCHLHTFAYLPRYSVPLLNLSSHAM